MKTENNHKKDYRKKIETQLHKLVADHLSNINKETASKLSKTIQDSVKQIAKKFYKSHFSSETEKNEKVISKIVKAKSFKKITSKKVPDSLSAIKFDKIFEKQKDNARLKKAAKKQTAVKIVAPKKVIAKKSVPVKKITPTKKAVVSNPIAKKNSSVLSNIPKEFKLTISKKTSKK